MKKYLLLLFVLVLAYGCFASVVYEFNSDQYSMKETNGFQSIIIPNTQHIGSPGQPALPWYGIKLALPLNTEATKITIERTNPQTSIISKWIEPIQQQYPLSQTTIKARTAPDLQIYNSDNVFPADCSNGIRTEYLSGQPIAFTAITPFDYNPVKNELTHYHNIRVIVETQTSERSMAAMSLLKQERFISDYIKKSVDNPELVPNYDVRTVNYEYIIVIDQAKYTQWLPLQDLYEQRGLNVLIKSIQEITATYPGADTQAKLRNYFIDMYANNSLRYVLLAADTEIIPHRGFYVNFSGGDQVDADIPADMYYSCLDGTWNNDNDAYWGEIYETDMAPEFAIGRFCYNNNTEIANFINKVMMYQIAPVESQVKTVLMVGEWLWDGPTWGGDYMDEMIVGSDMHGYSTIGVPSTWDISTMYDRTYGYENGWTGSQLRSLLSQGPNLINHLGHSSTNYNMRMSNNQVTATNITNNGATHNYSIDFSQGCYAGAFDNRDTEVGSYVSDCIAEKFTSIATSAVGMIAHSRYGWGTQGSTDGASQYLHRQYMDAIFGENIHELGFTLVDSKIDNIPFITNSPVMYWVTYETNLLGDPAMMIWTDTPQQISVQLPTTWSVGVTNYQIQTNAPGANLRIKQEGNIICEAVADNSGLIAINMSQSLSPGSYELYLNAPNFYQYQNIFTADASQMPYIVCRNIVLSDDDDLLHSGDLVNVSLWVKNVGMVNQANQGTLTLSSVSPNISIIQNSISFNAIAAADSTYVPNAFQVQIGGYFEDLAVAQLQFTAQYDTYSTQTPLNIALNAPVLSIASYSINNSSNVVMPGQTPSISFIVHNNGSGNAASPMLILMPNDPMINISAYEVYIPQVQHGEDQVMDAAFTIQISENLPLGSSVSIPYLLGSENGSSFEGVFTINVGVMNYTFETDWEGWTTVDYTTSHVNMWNRNNGRNFTTGGSYSMKFGGSGTNQYNNMTAGSLISPTMTLGQNSQLKFYHWIDAEVHSNATGMAWDGAMVQMLINNSTWIPISPVGGYPYRIYTNAQSPFAANTFCYSGSHTWQEATFDLSQYSGTVKFRFIFGSDSGSTGEGWYIDNVRLESDFVGTDDQVNQPRLSLSNFPNPFNPTTTISYSLEHRGAVDIQIYNLKGQLIRTLISNSIVNPGSHTVVWDGTDDNGRSVASSMYFYKLQSGNRTIMRKMLLLK
ncbi:MAG: hypothetical protein CVU48_07410 [Candidatus Cloacimonetes bacterium HGW-Cloacimonetes-1]|jgi:hypothetical protein|nr:MAG: hypothetical protein CVU48_07410 [Candidatus Cloacimonetes bacterium HGW-Cloacimonetes-1]